jgi:DNA-binding CsgD family transcriptional regulator
MTEHSKDADRPRMMMKLRAAQAGDARAKEDVALWVYQRWSGRVLHFVTPTTGLEREDLEQTFFENIYRSIDVAKLDVGCPLYHISQRAYWAVQSYVRFVTRGGGDAAATVRRRDPRVMEAGEVPLYEQEPDPYDGQERIIEQLDAEHWVKALAGAKLKPREREVLALIASDDFGGPQEGAFNRRLAERLGVSAQRASQLMASIEAVVRKQEATAVA